jgi:HD-GYP domain-containing protein (c-di-GMP phosphodiesterase class II)
MPVTTTSSELFSASLPTPGAALDAVDKAREQILDYEQEVEARLKAAQDEVLRLQAQAQTTQAELANAQGEALKWRNQSSHLEEQMRQAQAQAAAQISAVQAQAEARINELQARSDAEVKALQAQLQQHAERSKNLQRELLEVYRDLRAEDLPTLILRVGMNLVGAENGLFVEADGEGTLASVGLDDLPEPICQSLYRFTKQAAETEEPVVCNDSSELPDGAALVNLAALPVSVKNDLRGVLLVANKREGGFDDNDTELLLAIGRHAGIALENHRLHCALADSFVSTVAVLADAIEVKDPYTRGHCEGVSDLAARVAERLGWDKNELDFIRYAALLHDVGKIGIPDGILLKPSSLSVEEFSMMKGHVTIGRDLVARVPSLEPAVPIVFHHHERWDGGGYPDGLSGDEIPLGARIVGAVDALDAMTTKRSYREAMNLHDAAAEIERCAGTQFDPRVVETLLNVLHERAPLAA